MFRNIIFASALTLMFPLLSQAQHFTNSCILIQGTSTGRTFVELAVHEAEEAQRACSCIPLGETVPACLSGEVRNLLSRKVHNPKAERECRKNNLHQCKFANLSGWSGTCCIVSFP